MKNSPESKKYKLISIIATLICTTIIALTMTSTIKLIADIPAEAIIGIIAIIIIAISIAISYKKTDGRGED